jgi:hypothetical protein
VIAFVKSPLPLACLAVLGALFLWQHRRGARLLAVGVGLLFPLALVTLSRIGLLALGIEHLAQHHAAPSLPPPVPVAAGQPRVVWILFDETDQRLAFDQRPSGLQMPEFDRFRQETLYATNAYPPGDSTLLSIPGLLSGVRFDRATIKSSSDLELRLADTGQTTGWRALPSVFDSARELGVNSALVGWYHPYDRVLGRSLSYCSWYPHFSYESARAPTYAAALWRELACLGGSRRTRQIYIELSQKCLADAQECVTNRAYGLVFLHLPPPHKPGIYDPATGQCTSSGVNKVTGYFNNLALADLFLGKVRRALESADEWDTSWVILSADHSWRESELYDHRRDLRVPFLLKAPGQTNSVVLEPRLNTVLTHDLVLAVLKSELTNTASCQTWLEIRRSSHTTALDKTHD